MKSSVKVWLEGAGREDGGNIDGKKKSTITGLGYQICQRYDRRKVNLKAYLLYAYDYIKRVTGPTSLLPISRSAIKDNMKA